MVCLYGTLLFSLQPGSNKVKAAFKKKPNYVKIMNWMETRYQCLKFYLGYRLDIQFLVKT